MCTAPVSDRFTIVGLGVVLNKITGSSTLNRVVKKYPASKVGLFYIFAAAGRIQIISGADTGHNRRRSGNFVLVQAVCDPARKIDKLKLFVNYRGNPSVIAR